MGVEIRLNTLAVDMDHHSITVKGPDGVETIPTRTRIWAAGVQASPLARMLGEKAGIEVDRAGRLPVQPDCSLAGHPEIFAVGDMVSLNKLPGVAQPAMQEGKYVAGVIADRLSGKPAPAPFKYFDKGSMATIGYRAAVADAFGMKFTGLIAYGMWMFIHMLYLVGWGNRLGTVYTWLRALVFTKNRGHRIITFEQATDRLDEGLTASGRPAPITAPRKPNQVPAANQASPQPEAFR
jgi:NADH:ubiquinone reductase (H+-translocating)